VKTIQGFELQEEREIKEYRTVSRLYRHLKTGAQVLSLSNDDENKVFGITFRTPPRDSTGVAHILEHSVLCGSRKYPVKEPFVELLKGSLQTFLNAFTYPDRTCYPVASQNLKDFYNLIDVYLDAVFYPILDPYIFKQEGWHIEAESEEGPFRLKGVVYNEMKGAYSSPDNLLGEYSIQSLFPDTPYGLDSGGNPKEIPNLTYEQFKAFHATYYHPSNARIYFYGDDDAGARLELLREYLDAFDPMEVDSTVPTQPRFREPRRVERAYMTEDESAKAMLTSNWLIANPEDPVLNFSLRILEYILLGMPGSPLRRALIESGLGEDIAGEGLGAELRQIYLSTGLKGMDPRNESQVLDLIDQTLRDLVQKGIDPETIEAAINTIEFRLRENNTGSYPRGLIIMLRALSTWVYDSDPHTLLAFEKPLDEIKKKVSSSKRYFEALIEQTLLQNPHRSVLILRPDPQLRKKEEEEERLRISKISSNLTPAQLRQLVKDTMELKRRQQEPDPPQALAKIPSLGLQDLDKINKTIPLAEEEASGIRVLFHDLFTSRICYLDLGFDLHCLEEHLLPYVPLFGRALLEMGTEKEDYVSLTRRISQKTGGIHAECFSSPTRDSSQSAAKLFLRAKAMTHGVKDMLDILRDVLLIPRLDNQERFQQMVMEEKAQMEQRLIPAGHQMVNLRLRSHFCEPYWLAEKIGGISYLFFLRELAEKVKNHWPEVLEKLEQIKETLIRSRETLVNVTLDEDNYADFREQLEEFLSFIPEGDTRAQEWQWSAPGAPNEGLVIPAQVNYVGKATNLYELGYQFHGSALVISKYLRTTWLWEKVRVQGGAYGAFSLFDRLGGIISFVSYRDPNLQNTLDAFDGAASFLESRTMDERELTSAIVGTIGDLDAPLLPDAKGYTSMLRYLTGDTDEARQEVRDQVLSTSPGDFKAFAQILAQFKEKGIVKVMGSPAAIEQANQQRPSWLHVLKVL